MLITPYMHSRTYLIKYTMSASQNLFIKCLKKGRSEKLLLFFFLKSIRYLFSVLIGPILTFDPDVAVPLEVVIGCLPGVPIVTQQSDRWARPDRDVTHPFLI